MCRSSIISPLNKFAIKRARDLKCLKVKGETFMRDVFDEINGLIEGTSGWTPTYSYCPRCGGRSWEALKTYSHCAACLYFEDDYQEPFHFDRDLEAELEQRARADRKRKRSKLTASRQLLSEKNFPTAKEEISCPT